METRSIIVSYFQNQFESNQDLKAQDQSKQDMPSASRESILNAISNLDNNIRMNCLDFNDSMLREDDIRQIVQSEEWFGQPLLILVLGASGDLAKKKTYPALYDLWQQGLLPRQTIIWGYARTVQSDQELRDRLRPYLIQGGNAKTSVNHFLSLCYYRHGNGYGDKSAMLAILNSYPEQHNLVVYLAVPPHVFTQSTLALRMALSQAHTTMIGFVRIVLEKPFGYDTKSCKALLNSLKEQMWDESELYRIDHYLGKEMVLNIVTIRRNNPWLQYLWNKDLIQSVHIIFKEPFGTEGRGGYFDSVGIIRDICQNHLLQLLTLLAMELPEHMTSTTIRDAKVDVLKNIPAIKSCDCLHGQYEGYKDDPTISDKGTKTPTYVCLRSFVNTPTWQGVPFIIEAGKALDEQLCEARLVFRGTGSNALVLRLQPRPAIVVTTNIKRPGFTNSSIRTHVGIGYGENNKLPEAYTRLFIDILRGNQANFVRDDELIAAWEVFTPLLNTIKHKNPVIYRKGSEGPNERANFLKGLEIVKPWVPPHSSL